MIINNDYFIAVPREILTQDGVQTASDGVLFIADGDKNAHKWKTIENFFMKDFCETNLHAYKKKQIIQCRKSQAYDDDCKHSNDPLLYSCLLNIFFDAVINAEKSVD